MNTLRTKILVIIFILATLAITVFFRNYFLPSNLSNGISIEGNLTGVKIFTSPRADCEYVQLPFTPFNIHSTHSKTVWVNDVVGNKYLVSVFSRDKKCKEVATIKSALTNRGIKYEEDGNDIHVVGHKEVKSEEIAHVLKVINHSIGFKPRSMLPHKLSDTPVKYVLYENGQLDELTEANYGISTPKINYPLTGVGFDIFTATTFGLRAYFISAKGNAVSEGGDYNTAFYSVAKSDSQNILLVSEPGHGKIFSYNKSNGQLSTLIDGYSATSIRIFNSKLYFAGYVFGKEWDRTSLYEYDFFTKKIRPLTKPIFADVRGIALHKDKLYISDGAHNRLVVLDAKSFQVLYYWLGFTYPNGISITPKGNLLVADEHAGVIREISLQTTQELRSIGYGLVRSPAHVEEVAIGTYRGDWLIADADNNRLLLIDPSTTEIHAEIGGLRSVFDFVILPPNS